MDAETEARYREWLLTRPQCVQRLAEEFPLGSAFEVDGRTLYLLGYTENDMLIVSGTWPGDDYVKANETKEYVCAKHFRKVCMKFTNVS